VAAARIDAALTAIAEAWGPPALLHSHFYANALPLVTLHDRGRLRFVHTEHSTRLTGISPRPGQQLTSAGRRRAAAVFAAASEVMVVSAYLRDRLQALGFHGPFTVVPNPVDTTRFRPPGDGATRSSRLFAAARLDVDKGIDVVLRALAAARNRGADVGLDIAGSGPSEAALRALARELGVDEAVRFLGRLSRDDMAGHMRDALALVMGSRVETFGIVAAEAIASGTPVIAPRACSLPEIVGPDTGLLYEPEDADACATAMVSIARAGDAYPPLALAAIARDRFSMAVVGERLAEIYERCGRSPA
jgi:glycosyltransferase involved in cell wall biosynthesis